MSAPTHTSPASYVKIGILLGVITLVEISLPSWSAQTTYNVLLISLAAVKFWFVAQIFMHLKQDGKLVGGIFALGLLMAGGTIWALLAMMNPNVGNPSQRSETTHTAEGEIGDGVDGEEDGGEEPHDGGDEAETSPEELAALVERGALLATAKGCSVCHSTDGTRVIGPTWQGLLGREERMVDGSTLVVDEAYIRESITDPTAKVVDTFVAGMMPKTPLTDDELDALVAYIMSL
ncbi:c-type cytochrome [bacterium]|nr:c-type cytochrome [bacterium]